MKYRIATLVAFSAACIALGTPEAQLASGLVSTAPAAQTLELPKTKPDAKSRLAASAETTIASRPQASSASQSSATNSGKLHFNLALIDWQAIGAIATLAAVIVALVPIYRDWKRTRAHARNLRIRVGAKLTVIRPSLELVIRGSTTKPTGAILSPEEFADVVRSLTTMLQESAVLEKDEQNLLSRILANLEIAQRLYGSNDFAAESAQFIFGLIKNLDHVMARHGLLADDSEKPSEEH